MALAPEIAPSGDATVGEGGGGHVDAPELRLFVMGLFFIFGGITSLNDVIIPKLKELFTLNYTQAMLVQFCFFTAYLVIGIPGAKLVKKIGYMRGAVAGLLTMMVGCLLFIPASQYAVYGLFLFALFVLASGVVVVQVVSNPLISLLGKPETAHSRLTFAQAFNSLGTTIFPIVGSVLILGSLATLSADQLSGAELDAYRTAESQAIMHGYLGIAVALAVVAAIVWKFRKKLPHDPASMAGKDLVRLPRYAVGLALIIAGAIVATQGHAIIGLLLILLAPVIWLYDNDLLTRPRFSFGALCIFLYVGAEVSIGSLVVSYLMQPGVMALPEQAAGKLIGFYWGGAMIGRFIGSGLMRVISPGKLLAFVAAGAIALIFLSTNTAGAIAGYSLLAIGLMNSIMFPTIFSLASEKLGTRAADGSGIINVAIFGGAVVPLATGVIADFTGSLGTALLLPALCYAVIACFGIYARRPAV
ncbi:sugar MFS transporter [Sphingopyxis sp. R3-92]|uniref:sugar MFS transporter n=1 Tax=Sphingopyxis sp. R3-92 TaxID=3158553 RepID=UPI003EE717A1